MKKGDNYLEKHRNWRSIFPNGGDSFQIIHDWRNTSHVAHENKDHECVDIVSRVAFQLRALEIRLRELSNSYSRELESLVDTRSFDPESCVETRNTFYIELAIHSYLTDACTLRDYLAEYLGKYKYCSDKPIGSHAGLIKLINQEQDDFSRSLIDMSDQDKPGWLAELTAYRNLVVHSVPLSYAGKRARTFQRINKFRGGSLPSLFYPLPDDPIKITRERSQRGQDGSYEEYWNRLYHIKGEIDHIFTLNDALEYCWSVNGKLFNYAKECITFSPYTPEMAVITDEDIIGNVEFN